VPEAPKRKWPDRPGPGCCPFGELGRSPLSRCALSGLQGLERLLRFVELLLCGLPGRSGPLFDRLCVGDIGLGLSECRSREPGIGFCFLGRLGSSLLGQAFFCRGRGRSRYRPGPVV